MVGLTKAVTMSSLPTDQNEETVSLSSLDSNMKPSYAVLYQHAKLREPSLTEHLTQLI